MKKHVGIGMAVVALFWLGITTSVRGDFVFTSQPINGHVIDFWIGINPESGDGSLSVDMKDPTQPALFIAGSTGRHFLRLGVNVDGVGVPPDTDLLGDLPELVPGNPAHYTFHYQGGIVTLNFQATTSPGGQVTEDPDYDQYALPQPGFTEAGWTTFNVTGTGLSTTFDVTVFDTGDVVGIQSLDGQKVTWNDPREVEPQGGTGAPTPPVKETPEPTSALLLGMGALAWWRMRRRFSA